MEDKKKLIKEIKLLWKEYEEYQQRGLQKKATEVLENWYIKSKKLSTINYKYILNLYS